MTLPPGLATALEHIAQNLSHVRHPWSIIGSTAVAIYANVPVVVHDIDILTSCTASGKAVTSALGGKCVHPAPSDTFRSDLFSLSQIHDYPVEIMSNLHVRTGSEWVHVAPDSMISITFGGHNIYIPEKHELAAMLRLFNRKKDIERIKLLKQTSNDSQINT